jgi:antirestriction protein
MPGQEPEQPVLFHPGKRVGLRYYIDYDAIARDMQINGEIAEIDRELIVTNAQEF